MTPIERACFSTNREKKTLCLNDLQTKRTIAINILFARELDAVIKRKANFISRFYTAKELIEEREKELKNRKRV
jgi:hypothetical protein